MEFISKYFPVILVILVMMVLVPIHVYDITTNRKITGVIENVEYLSEKRAAWWEAGERYERYIKLKIKLSDKKKEELLLKGSKDDTTFLQGEKYIIKYRRGNGKILGKGILDD
jgi:hypothetical protein